MADSSLELLSITEYDCYPLANRTECWATISVQAVQQLQKSTERRPVDIVAVIDKSDSMNEGKKLEYVKETLLFIVDQLKKTDRFSLVTYNTRVKVDFHLADMHRANKDRFKAVIRELTAENRTDLCGGLVQGMQEIASRGKDSGRVQSVLLLTDGIANEGIYKTDGILNEMRKSNFAGTVNTFGVGRDHDSSLLHKISSETKGSYYYIESDSEEKIVGAFANCVGGLLSVIGANLSLEVKTVDGTTISEVHSVHWNPDNKKDTDSCVLKLGDIHLREQKTILLKLCLPKLKENVINIHLEYFDMKQSSKDTTAILTVRRSDGPNGTPKPFVDEQRERAKVAEAFKNAHAHACTGKLVEAKTVLKDTMTYVHSKALHDELTEGLVALDSDDPRHAQHYMLSKMHSGCPIS
jgi:Mg-chelatase subunit ChlD